MNNLLKAYTFNFTAGHKAFLMKYCLRKDCQQSIAMLSKHWGKSHGEFVFLTEMKAAELLLTKLDYDSCIVMNRLGEFYICIPKLLDVRAENQGPALSEISNGGEIFYLLFVENDYIFEIIFL